MKKLIDIEPVYIHKLKIIAAFENISLKKLIEKVMEDFIKSRENEKLKLMSEQEKEDLGLYLLMKEAQEDEFVDEKEVMKILEGK